MEFQDMGGRAKEKMPRGWVGEGALRTRSRATLFDGKRGELGDEGLESSTVKAIGGKKCERKQRGGAGVWACKRNKRAWGQEKYKGNVNAKGRRKDVKCRVRVWDGSREGKGSWT